MSRSSLVFAAGSLLGLAVMIGCGDSVPKVATATAPGGSKDQSHWPADDRSMCDWRNKPELEVAETAGPGALKPTIRRVFKTFGDGDSRHRTLACMEVDTNLDGVKDVVRTFNAKGEVQHEEADRDYDGKIDVWINFVDGRLAEEDVDTNHDGKPDVWKFYVNGDLQRIRRDRNFDGVPDEWEMYAKGRLERVGLDETGDGHVDRWDRDEQLKYEAEAADRKAHDDSDGGAEAGTTGAASSASDAGAPAPKAAGKRAKK
jgi:hypothetical protein